MNVQDSFHLTGKLIATIECDPSELHRVKIGGAAISDQDEARGRLVFERNNLFVNTGLQISLDRIFGIGGPPAAPTGIALSADDQAVTVSTTLLDPAGGDTGFVRKAFSVTPTRASQTVTCTAVFTQADLTFVANKVGLLNTDTDAGTGLIDVVGGTGNSPFTIDLTGVTSFTLTIQILVTASN